MANDTTTSTAPVPIELPSLRVALRSPDTVDKATVEALYGLLTPEYKQYAVNIQSLSAEFKKIKESGILPENMSLEALYEKLHSIGQSADAKADPVVGKLMDNIKDYPVLGGMLTATKTATGTVGFLANTTGTAIDTAKLPFQLAGAAVEDIFRAFGRFSNGMSDEQAYKFAVIFAAAQQDAYQPLAAAYDALPGGATPFKDWTPFDGKDSRFESHIGSHIGAVVQHAWYTVLAWPVIGHIAAAAMAAWQMASAYFSGEHIPSWSQAFAQASAQLQQNARTVGSVQEIADNAVHEDLRAEARSQAAGKIRGFYGKDAPETSMATAAQKGLPVDTTNGSAEVDPKTGEVKNRTTPKGSGSAMVDQVAGFAKDHLSTPGGVLTTLAVGVPVVGGLSAVGAKVLPPALGVVKSAATAPYRGLTALATGLYSGTLQASANMGEMINGAGKGASTVVKEGLMTQEARAKAAAEVRQGFAASNAANLERELTGKQAELGRASTRLDAAKLELEEARAKAAEYEDRFKNSSRKPTWAEGREGSKLRGAVTKLEGEVHNLGQSIKTLNAEITEPTRRMGGLRSDLPSLQERAAAARNAAGAETAAVARTRAMAQSAEALGERVAGTGRVMRGVGGVGRIAGRAAPYLAIAQGGYDLGSGIYELADDDASNNREGAKNVTTGGTTLAGAGIGVWFGGPVGAGIGATIGWVVGKFGGGAVVDAVSDDPNDPNAQERAVMAAAQKQIEAARQAEAQAASLQRRDVTMVDIRKARSAVGGASITGGEDVTGGGNLTSSTPPRSNDILAALGYGVGSST